MDKFCRDCKHWEPPTVDALSTDVPTFGTCQLAGSDDGEPEHKSLAVAFDSEGYMAWLRTSPAFGCVQFEER